MDKKYKLINNITGWFVFVIAAATYILTAESSASYWDCGEFIATAFKFEVGHPPGDPVFMLIAKFFSLFSFGDPTKVGFLLNVMSALASALTILFLFWTITHIARKIRGTETSKYTLNDTIIVMGAGAVGALAYTFSDTFWFSAVEAEVYAMSSLFTAIVFWLILKWESEADHAHATKWIILIAYLMGLSIGVHLLNLLTIPAIVFVYYFKKYPVTKKGVIITSLIALGMLASVMYVIIPYSIIVASWFELFFVNSVGCPFETGVVVYGILLIGGLIYGIYKTHVKRKVVLNTILLCFTVILIGYSSFAIVVIRAKADTPIDENNPENVFSLLSYLNREQYGDRPLFSGQYFNSPAIDQAESSKVYTPLNGRYEVTSTNSKYVYDPATITLFPRMYSSEDRHAESYKQWGGFTEGNGKTVTTQDGNTLEIPTFGQNLKYFFSYQISWMYIRYLMWNFAGRQNDNQGHGDILNGNWVSGISLIDNPRLGDQSKLPTYLKENKGHNEYYLLPFILGIMGLVFLFGANKKDFTITILLFFLTGLAIVIYLNQPPMQPRERDYAYAGSFYAFAIWIGIGVMSVYELLKKWLGEKAFVSALSVGLCILLVPTIMAKENWDDHDRSGRYLARDFAKNYLNSCAQNAIVFTNGDNDTFPLWYVQEVEGFRTDVRVCNLSLFQTDWYMDQMRRKAYDSDPVPMQMTADQYRQGTRDVVIIDDKNTNPIDIASSMKFVLSEDPQAKAQTSAGSINYFPSKVFVLPVNKDNALGVNDKNKESKFYRPTVKAEDKDKIADQIIFSPKQRYIYKNHLGIMDMLANFNWKRPLYFANAIGDENYLGLQNYFQCEGFAYRLTPIKNENNGGEKIDVDILYNNVMNNFYYGGLENHNIYIDENSKRMVMNMQTIFFRLANALADEYEMGKMANPKDSASPKLKEYLTKAEKVLDKCVCLTPNKQMPYEYINLYLAQTYYRIGKMDKGDREITILIKNNIEMGDFFISLSHEMRKSAQNDAYQSVSILNEAIKVAHNFGRKDIVNKYSKNLETYAKLFQ